MDFSTKGWNVSNYDNSDKNSLTNRCPYMRKPRDPSRMPRILKKIALIWEKNPDLRFIQLVMAVGYSKGSDSFYMEDETLEQLLDIEMKKHGIIFEIKEQADENGFVDGERLS